MHNSQINTRYARALYLLAEEKGKLDLVRNDMDTILRTVEENSEIDILLEHPIIKPSKKTQIFADIFGKDVSEHTMLFLNLIVKNKRENHLKHICKNYITIYKNRKGIKTAVLTTSFDLTRTHKEKLRKTIEESFKSPVELETKVNKSVIGGLLIQVDDKQLDLTVSRQIQRLKDQFLNIDFNNKKGK
jgi:F-type H+-transporting ATPase subunit delta